MPSNRRQFPSDHMGRRGEKKSSKPAAPETYDELMDAAVEAEEKGERFGKGPKAAKFFEQSLLLYQQADRISPCFDSRYNIARVLYQLGTNFHIPPFSFGTLQASVQAYKVALAMTTDEGSQADAGYNLAQALLDLGESLELFGAPESSTQAAQSVRLEAVQLLQKVLDREKRILSEETPAESRSITDLEPPYDRSVVLDTRGPISVNEQHVPTAGSYIETTLLLVDAQTDFWAGRDTYPASEEQQAIEALLQDARSRASEPWQQAILLLGEVDAALVLESLRWEQQMDVTESTTTLQNLLSRVECLPVIPNGDDQVRFEVDKANASADLHALIAMRMLRSGEAGSPIDFQKVWSHLSHSITILNRAMQLPISPLTMPLAKSSMLCDLTIYSLSRACLADLGFEAAQRSRHQLIANAEVYANRALAEGGWGWLCSVAVSTSSVGAVVSTAPSQGGYVKEDLMEKALWTLCRSLLLATLSPATSDATETKLPTLLAKLTEMSAARGRRIDPARLERYLRDLEREQGPLSATEADQWTLVSRHLALQQSMT